MNSNKPAFGYIMLFVALLFSRNVDAQEKNISLELGETTVGEVLKSIENETDYYFLFNQTLIDVDRPVYVYVDRKNVTEILEIVFSNTDIEYIILKNQIVLSPRKYIPQLNIATTPITVSGKVLDQNNRPLPGASVMIKGTATGTITNAEGEYSIQVSNPDNTLEYSFIGYQKVSEDIGGRDIVNIKMKENLLSLKEVVKIGYGDIPLSDLTGAVSTLNSKEINNQINSDVSASLQGKIAGVSIESPGNHPGSEMRITVRGSGSLNNNNPLILVDEVPVTSLQLISPSNIKSIQILKDASAAAIYGSRAANGVILIETKSGIEGRTKINASIDYGIQELDKGLDLTNAEEWILLNTTARNLAGLDSTDSVRNPEVDIAGGGTDWQKAMYKKAPIKRIDMNLSGGGETGKYNISLGYLDQKGIVTNTSYNSLHFQMKSELQKNKFRFGENIIINRDFHNNITDNASGSGNAIQSAVIANPLSKIYLAEGEVNSTENPLGTGNNVIGLLNLIKKETTTYRFLMNAYSSYEFSERLVYKIGLISSGYFSNFIHHRANFSEQNIYAMGSAHLNQPSQLIENNSSNILWQVEQFLTYKRNFGPHSINAILGQTSQKNSYRSTVAEVFGVPNNLWVLSAGNENPDNSGSISENTLLSFFGRLIYSYNTRYSFTATLRRDGSSRFSEKHRWGYFPSIAAAWNIANEDFFRATKSTIPVLKLRFSYGLLGNQEIGDYQYLARIDPSYLATIGNPARIWTGAIQNQYPALDIKWESTRTGNIGMDLNIYERLDLSMDYFHKTTTDLLLRVPIPLSTGVSAYPFGNAGKIINRGFETSFSYNNNIGDIYFTLSGNFSSIKNKVEELGYGTQELEGGRASHHGDYVNYTREGYPIYSFFLIKTDGLFRSADEVAAHSKDGVPIQPSAQPGDFRFIDANGDGQISDEDRVFCGSPFPDFDYGLNLTANWRMLDLSVFFQGTYGNKIYNGYRTYTESLRYNSNYSRTLLNSYTFNKDSDIPRLTLDDPNGNDIDNSDRYLEDGSYLRLKTITLGINMANFWFKNWSKVEVARFYIGIQNLFTITPYTGYNSDIGGGGFNAWRGALIDRGIDWSVYPTARSYHAGIQFSF